MESATPTPSKPRAAHAGAIAQLLPDIVQSLIWSDRKRATELLDQMLPTLETVAPRAAGRLRRLLPALAVKTSSLPAGLLETAAASFGLDKVFLPASTFEAIQDFLFEIGHTQQLLDFRVTPRHRVLLHGPPRNGKTTLAEALAFELQVPLLRLRYAGVISSHLGETGAKLASVFDYAASAPCVLFLDEVDGVASTRGSINDVGEMSRTTNQLLLAIDRLPPTTVLVAATNRRDHLDEAFAHRFDLVLALPPPSLDVRLACARAQLDPTLTPGHDVSHLAERIANRGQINLSLVVSDCKQVRRHLALKLPLPGDLAC